MFFSEWIRASLARQGVEILQAFFVREKGVSVLEGRVCLWLLTAVFITTQRWKVSPRFNFGTARIPFNSVSIETVEGHNAGLPEGLM